MEVLEEWRDVVGYEGLYQVSSLGRVRNSRGLIRKQDKNHNGYMRICLSKNGKPKKFQVHRLVYTSFVGDIPDGMQIDHINVKRDDNRIDNLRSVSPMENRNNPITVERVKEERRRRAKDPQWRQKNRDANRARAKAVLQLDISGKVIREWECLADAARGVGIAQSSVSQCCNGKRSVAGGYRWCFCLDKVS